MSLIRFLFNFILFGALFYLIWHFFPDTFNVLVSWVKAIIDFVQQAALNIYHQFSTAAPRKEAEPVKAALGMILTLFKI